MSEAKHTPGPWYPMPCDDERFMCMSAVSAVSVPNENNDQYEDHDPNDMIAIFYHQCLPAVRPDDHEAAYNNAEFVATFNPATALALLDEIAALRKENEGLMAERDRVQVKLSDMKRLAKDAFNAWDDDLDSRVGKILQAMLGPGYARAYRPDVPSLHEDCQAIDAARATIGDSHEA